jgi:tellurite resistance protein TerC
MTIAVWGGFILVVLALLALDLGVLNRRPHVIKPREALMWTGFWVSLAMCFNVFIYFAYNNHWLDIGTATNSAHTGQQAAVEFFTAYLVEQSLSLDNIFVIALIFGYFGIPLKHQHRVLFWGIVGVLVMRGIMIVGGMALIHKFEWMTYLFGVMLLGTAVKLLTSNSEEIEPEHNPLIKLTRRMVPVVDDMESGRFFVWLENGKRAVTPLFLVLLLVESTDLLFAIDSIPACFAVTQDPFLVFTSNIFAVLGLRSLYFALAAIMGMFKYLKHSLVFLLAFIGVKMLLVHTEYKIDAKISLLFIGGILGVGIIASLIAAKRERELGDFGQSELDGIPPEDDDR